MDKGLTRSAILVRELGSIFLQCVVQECRFAACQRHSVAATVTVDGKAVASARKDAVKTIV